LQLKKQRQTPPPEEQQQQKFLLGLISNEKETLAKTRTMAITVFYLDVSGTDFSLK
jgi:hypothetical protein